MKLAIVSLKGKSSEAIARAAAKYFDAVSSFHLRNITVGVDKETRVMHENKDLADYDCVYLRGSYNYADLLISIALALKGKVYLPVTDEALAVAHNKFLTEVKLKDEKIPLPKTHLVYKEETAKIVANSLHYPVVFKMLSGTHGKGVMFAESAEGANSLIDMLSKIKEPYIIQEYVETGATDIRALVVGRRVIAMERVAKEGELRAGIHSGGIGRKIELDYDNKQLARKVAKTINADICAVDMLKGATKTVVTEVNLSPGIIGLTDATKINVASKIAKSLYRRTEEFKRGKAEDKQKLFDISALGNSLSSAREMITNIVIKAGRIILPPALTEITDFFPDEEVSIKVEKDKIEVKKLKKEGK